MVWWQTLLVALASSVVGGALANTGAYVLYRQQERTYDRRQTARVLGTVLAALREIDPSVYVERLRIDRRGGDLILEKRERWLAAAGELDVLAARHPDSEVGTLWESVIDKGELILIRLDEMVGASAPPSQAWYDAIPPRHDEAVRDARELVRRLLR